MADESIIDFGQPHDMSKNIIKVIGVGGAGCNAVGNMYKEGIVNVSFAVCNTDSQSLAKSSVPVKLMLGKSGLGAGANPEIGRKEALQNIEDIKKLFDDSTKLVFVTAGMGGGTGTGAAPVVARIAKEKGILTIGIVTIPFYFEKRKKIMMALKGVEEMRKNVDALLIINNERLCDVYSDSSVTIKEAFGRADDILGTATKSISELITVEGDVNLDFRDVESTMRGGGGAIMTMGRASGEHRVERAILNALDSPLLYGSDISKAKRILFNIYASEKAPLFVKEMNEIDAFMDALDPDIEVIWGVSDDNSLGDDAKVTILATGLDDDFNTATVSAEDRGEEFYNMLMKELYRPYKNGNDDKHPSTGDFFTVEVGKGNGTFETVVKEETGEQEEIPVRVNEVPDKEPVVDNVLGAYAGEFVKSSGGNGDKSKRPMSFIDRVRMRMEKFANDFTKDYANE